MTTETIALPRLVWGHAQKGASLIDTLVGVALMLLVFVGIAGAFQLSIELVSNNKARIGASALAQEQLEYIRSLAYDNMAVVGGIPAGNIPQNETVVLNGVTYTRRTLIRYLDDLGDGIGGADTNGITADSKEVKVSVSWNSSNGARTIALASRASPPGVEQAVPGGTLSISVRNATLVPVASAQVRIENPSTTPAVDVTSFTDADGYTTFIGAPAATGYRITVTKSGYSTDQTYTAAAQNPNPIPGHLTVSNNQTTSGTFRIDLLAQKTVRSFKTIETLVWKDEFINYDKIATTTNTEVDVGELQLAGDNQYPESGEAQSVYVAPQYLYRWKKVRWTDNKQPQTGITYQVYYPGGGGPQPLPNAVLPGNIAGFTTSPIDLTSVSTTTYPSLRLRAVLTTQVPGQTPGIAEWEIEYDHGPEPLGSIPFTMTGVKIIGTDNGSLPIYKYNKNLTTNLSGVLALIGLEEDAYSITVDGAAIGYDIAESCEPQQRALLPASSMTTLLYFAPHTAHSLLVDVKNTSGALISGATARLYRNPGYDTTMTTSGCGQTFYPALSSGTVGTGNPYAIDVTAAGYQPYTASDVNVTGASRASVILNPL